MGFSSFQNAVVAISGTAAITGSVSLAAPITGTVSLNVSPFQKSEDTLFVNADVGIPVWEVRRDVCSASSITDGDYVTKNQDSDGFSYSRDKSYDAGFSAARAMIVNDLASRRVTTPISLISAAQNFTTTWADLGPEIYVDGFTRVGLWLNVTRNNSTNMRVKLLAKHTSGGTGEYHLPIKQVDTSASPWNVKIETGYYELNADTDQSIVITWDLNNIIPYVQFQIMTEVSGATSAQVTTADVTYAWGQ